MKARGTYVAVLQRLSLPAGSDAGLNGGNYDACCSLASTGLDRRILTCTASLSSPTVEHCVEHLGSAHLLAVVLSSAVRRTGPTS